MRTNLWLTFFAIVSQCTSLTEFTLAALRTTLPNLKHAVFYGIPNISLAGSRQLRNRLAIL
jgi:hypothetical protein